MSKQIVAGVVALVVVLVGVVYLTTARSEGVSLQQVRQIVAEQIASLGSTRQVADEFPEGLRLGDPGTSMNWVRGDMKVGSNRVGWKNQTGSKVRADLGLIYMDSGTASSTFRMALFATTTAPDSIPTSQDFTAVAEGNRALIQPINYATSTAATTTNSIMVAGGKVIEIPNGSWLVLYMQAVDSIACGAAGSCEEATSTARGFNPSFAARLLKF